MAGDPDGYKIEIIHWVVIDYDDDSKPISMHISNLLREFADWLDSSVPFSLGPTGNIGLPSGSVKWRRVP